LNSRRPRPGAPQTRCRVDSEPSYALGPLVEHAMLASNNDAIDALDESGPGPQRRFSRRTEAERDRWSSGHGRRRADPALVTRCGISVACPFTGIRVVSGRRGGDFRWAGSGASVLARSVEDGADEAVAHQQLVTGEHRWESDAQDHRELSGARRPTAAPARLAGGSGRASKRSQRYSDARGFGPRGTAKPGQSRRRSRTRSPKDKSRRART